MLTERRATILRLVVSDYVETAEPVSSRALVERHDLGVSSATVRNELARLEEDGYVTHPHTSAGRVPSEVGYRHYVRELMSEEPVSTAEQRTIEHQLHQVIGAIDEWLSLAATILASSVENVAVVTRPRAPAAHLKHVQVVELHGETALVVAVLDDGRVRQRIVTLDALPLQADLNARALRLNARLGGRDHAGVASVLPDLDDPDDARIATAVAELLAETRFGDDTYLDGLRAVLAQPEFHSVDRMLQAVQALDTYRVRQMLEQNPVNLPGQTHVLIGREHGEASMQDWSLIVTNYGSPDGALGTVAVLGPTRMRYDRAIPRVRYVAHLISTLITEAR